MNTSRIQTRMWIPAFAVLRRNFLVWRRLIGPAMVMNFGEPLLYLLGLGYGLTLFIGNLQGMSYMTFLASGIIASSTMTAASFEGMYSVFTRMVPQRTHEGMLATALDVEDILLGEWLWCAIKASFSTLAILLVAWLLDAAPGPWAVLVLPIGFVIGLAFAAPAIAMAAIAPTYDFFNYYFTLGVTPMLILSGVFYPVDQLPEALQWLVQLLPLSHAIELIRPLVAGQTVIQPWLHLAVLLIYSLAGGYVALLLMRRRLRV